jgi:hypothetical protein
MTGNVLYRGKVILSAQGSCPFHALPLYYHLQINSPKVFLDSFLFFGAVIL